MPIRLLPEPTGDEKPIRQKAEVFANERLRPTAIEDDERALFRREVFTDLGKLGLVGINVPKEYGGHGLSSRAFYACQEEIARASAAFSITSGVTSLTQGGLLAFGTEEQKHKWLPRMCSGEWIGAFSLSESQSGSDAAALKLAARKISGGYRLSGTKLWCSNAADADIFLVMARTSEDRVHGISSFIVLRNTPGFRVGKQENKLGVRASSLAELIFEDAFIPDDHLVGAEGQGFKVALSQLDAGRISIGVAGLAITVESIERACRHVHTERARGGHLLESSLELLADCFASAQSLKALIALTSDIKDKGERFTTLASQIKLLGSELAVLTANQAMLVLGERGYTREGEVERLLRDARALPIVEGTNQIQRSILARQLELTTSNEKETK